MALRTDRKAHRTPDWEKTECFVVDPSLWPFYCSSKSDVRPVYRDLLKAFESLNLEYHLLDSADAPVDIWIRDWGFVEGFYFNYQPSYARDLYSDSAVLKARTELTRRAKRAMGSVALILDGGNLVHNGKIAILTEKVLTDNAHIPVKEVERLVVDLGFERVVFIPSEPEDEVGHADGIARFLSSNQLLVNDYDHPHFSDYRRRLFACLENAQIPAEIVPFPWTYTEEKLDGVWSAIGAYINFIHTSKGIIYPTFGSPMDDSVGSLLGSLVGCPLVPVFATPLARFGGVLNCIVVTA